MKPMKRAVEIGISHGRDPQEREDIAADISNEVRPLKNALIDSAAVCRAFAQCCPTVEGADMAGAIYRRAMDELKKWEDIE